jgi:hypothetical protein
MPNEIDKEIDALAEGMEKSSRDPNDRLFEAIASAGPEGLRKALPTLTEDEKELLKVALEEMKKAVSMDDAYQAKFVQGNIKDTVIQEDKADDDQDEKLVKPAAVKFDHQGTPTPGWEGQVIKGKEMSKEDAKEKIYDMEEKEHGKKSPKKMVEAEKKEQDEKSEKPMKKGSDMKKCPCGGQPMEGLKKCKDCMKGMKKSIEQELGDKASVELVKSEMKKRLLAEESQLGDAPEMEGEQSRADKKSPEDMNLGEDNKSAQKKVNDLGQGKESKMRKAIWGEPNDLIRARTGGRNHHFSVNEYYNEVLKETRPTEEVKKSEPSKEDLNNIIAKSGDRSWDELECDRLVKANHEKISGKFTKSFADDEIAQALGLTEEEAKKILGE